MASIDSAFAILVPLEPWARWVLGLGYPTAIPLETDLRLIKSFSGIMVVHKKVNFLNCAGALNYYILLHGGKYHAETGISEPALRFCLESLNLETEGEGNIILSGLQVSTWPIFNCKSIT